MFIKVRAQKRAASYNSPLNAAASASSVEHVTKRWLSGPSGLQTARLILTDRLTDRPTDRPANQPNK